ncbi:hypothetical protein AVEN_127131-1 [Araneus ventricosus]|uniref:Uncharacterized protein n=1 Tax=Araneus ventricosus TaxID=182803 RepID=A0A4Y1ZMB5_ARAVE|nr:hypothetical protein AVEN_95062-1 [Araneus ventricosus]GBL57371.1 hypothetical protein AVEN_127131-1 [Araneus ventricosus]
MHLMEGQGQQINLVGWTGFSKLLENVFKTYYNHQRETYSTYFGQSSVSSRLINIGLGQRNRSDSFVFPNYIFVKTVIHTMETGLDGMEEIDDNSSE